MKRHTYLTYGIFCHALFLAVYLYMAGFFGNILAPKTIDHGLPPGAEPTSTTAAVIINILLILLFVIPHSVMARPAFKKWWTRIIPESIERSTYVLVSCILMIILMWQWRPIGPTVWEVNEGPLHYILHGLFVFGWLMVPLVSLLINHFDLLGTRQVWLHFQGKDYTPLKFRIPVVYSSVRHPLYVGWIIAFWATPVMTVGHLIFAITSTLYMIIAIPFEERDLIQHHGDDYQQYKQQVPALIPGLTPRKNPAPKHT